MIKTDNFFSFADLSLLKEANFIKELYKNLSLISLEKDPFLLPLIFSLGWIGDESSQNKLIELVSSEEMANVLYSTFILGQLDELSNFPIFSKLLKNQNELICNMAKIVIYWGGGRQCKISNNEIGSIKLPGLTMFDNMKISSNIHKKQSLLYDKCLFLSGVSGVGKTSVLHALRRLGIKNVLDLDEEVEKSTGYCLPKIFERFGESVFRVIERSVLLNCIHSSDAKIIALGGGTSAKRQTIQLLKEKGYLIHLTASYQTIKRRLRCSIEEGETNKAAVTLLDTLPDTFHQLLYLYREPFQVAASDYVIDTDNMTVNEIVNEICCFRDICGKHGKGIGP